MTEEQLRDILARVVPEPPDSVADPVPVVRAARRQRRARVAGITGLAALLAIGTYGGVRATADGERSLVVDQPTQQIDDPLTTAPCPSPDTDWPVAGSADLDALSAVRYCGRPVNGFPAADGAPDALVSELDTFRTSVAELPEADPSRCAAVDVIPSDSRLLVELTDGTLVGLSAGPCQNVELDGRNLDAAEVTLAFIDALRRQRDAHGYDPPADPAPLDCSSQSDVTPAAPGHEELVEAVACSSSDAAAGSSPLEADRLDALNQAWGNGAVLERSGSSVCADIADAATTIHARTDRGDTVVIQPGSEGGACDQLTYTSWLVPLPVERPEEQYLVMLPAYVLPISVDKLVG